MRLRTLLFLLPLGACATQARLVVTADDSVASLTAVADDLAHADFVALGEIHGSVAVHETHLALLRELQARRPDLVIAMEMFERDKGPVLLQYLAGVLDEGRFLAEARPWPRYERDYRPVIEFAKQHGLVVLAANAPRPLAAKVGKEGIEAVAGDPNVARTTTAPQDAYWDAFVEAMAEHGIKDDATMQRYYASQCLKDDTMAESIVDHLQAARARGADPLVVLICGKMHSDHRRGTVARVLSRMPDLATKVVSAEEVADLGAGVYASNREVADYVVVVEEQPKDAPGPVAAPAKHPVATPEDAPETAPSPQPTAVAAEPDANPEGMRPALGLMPDYAFAEGVRVESVRQGGNAEKAGIEEGDVIVAIGGVPVSDVQTYAEVLDEQRIGKLVGVRVKRGDAEVELQVLVGSRPR